MLFKTETGEVAIPDAQVAAVRNEAGYAAEHAVMFLRGCGAIPPTGDQPVRVPREYMLELGAALRVVEWRNRGLLEHLGGDPMPLLQTLVDFILRADRVAGQWHTGPDGAPLARLVFKTWLETFAWSGRRELGVDVVLRAPPQPSAEEVSAIAEFLWRNRHPAAPCSAAPPFGDSVDGE